MLIWSNPLQLLKGYEKMNRGNENYLYYHSRWNFFSHFLQRWNFLKKIKIYRLILHHWKKVITSLHFPNGNLQCYASSCLCHHAWSNNLWCNHVLSITHCHPNPKSSWSIFHFSWVVLLQLSLLLVCHSWSICYHWMSQDVP